MTHEEWMSKQHKEHDCFGNGIRQVHYDILRDENLFRSYVLDTRKPWFICELAFRKSNNQN
ncbi:Uncharacterised protein [Escherichia coli]|uniref:Uncharacterized protein n=1 Tax=Escherichia phage vB_Eco_slurp01 TaxID=1874688 RepID=A0A1C3S654_9CAUD|nr:hypothetical protein [Escherichia coli]QBO61679.1 hypothetical protein G17_00189 [Escherichia phage vB_EcoM_G17]WIL00988.1 hypothetical protein [Escherichia phage vB_EcoM_CRJP21]SCA80018.1 hypothetical protein PSLUR01_00035 [Escherichia phage vB_Eco_slurp01]MCU6292430.1 hypothetical protein [Escherichia coli]OTE92138.1 hypothetical protein B1K96_14820 [Escherichia coli]